MDFLGIMAIGIIICYLTAVKTCSSDSIVIGVLSFLLFAASGIGGMALLIFSYSWIAAEHKADLINRQLGTEYTQEDMFFEPDYIEEVREMHRK